MSSISLLKVIKSKFIPYCTAHIVLNQKICMLAQWTSPSASQSEILQLFFDVFDQFCPISALECFFFKIKYPISFERIEYIRSNEGLLLSLRCMEKIVYIFSDYLQIWPILKFFWLATDGK